MRLPFFLASRFVAAEDLDGAIPVVQRLNGKGLHVTLDLLGEYVQDRDVARRALGEYERLLRAIRARGLDSNISIKLSMLGQKIDEGFCMDNLRHLLAEARQQDIFVRLDMEGSDITESTLAMFEEVYPQYPDHVGVVLQAYLKRTARDVERMCELNARVRLCKGAYKEPPEIAYQKMDDIRARYVEYMQQLIRHARYPGIATHDDRLIAATKEFVARENLSRDRFEFQMLHGIRPETHEQLVRDGYHMRVYVPYGTDWMPYFSRRLRERKENVWFILKNLVRR
jgi:proline dehydrogenase